MVYVIVALIIIIRTFGFNRTMKFVTDFIDTLSKSGSKEVSLPWKAATVSTQSKQVSNNKVQPKRIKKPDWMIELKSASIKASSKADDGPRRNNATASTAQRKSRGFLPRLVQTNARSSEEILAGKPDFGWRRVY